ncbi:DUF3140 domain-containing protein [Lysobacter sp. D1-1-M9]|uniref:DUF3140 domain-containing protein n=2 Tax=Novilysobacter TaxID=3382699 RepID=UPI0039830C43
MNEDERVTLDEFRACVNMAPAELEKWLETDASREVGFKESPGSESVGHASGRRIVDLLRTRRAAGKAIHYSLGIAPGAPTASRSTLRSGCSSGPGIFPPTRNSMRCSRLLPMRIEGTPCRRLRCSPGPERPPPKRSARAETGSGKRGQVHLPPIGQIRRGVRADRTPRTAALLPATAITHAGSGGRLER